MQVAASFLDELAELQGDADIEARHSWFGDDLEIHASSAVLANCRPRNAADARYPDREPHTALVAILASGSPGRRRVRGLWTHLRVAARTAFDCWIRRWVKPFRSSFPFADAAARRAVEGLGPDRSLAALLHPSRPPSRRGTPCQRRAKRQVGDPQQGHRGSQHL